MEKDISILLVERTYNIKILMSVQNLDTIQSIPETVKFYKTFYQVDGLFIEVCH